MTTKNPFGSLTVKRDDDEEEHKNLKITQTTTVEDLLKSNLDQKRKRKIRPEEKKILEEEKSKAKPIEPEEGFKEIKKKKKTEEEVPEIEANNQIHKEDHRNKEKNHNYFPKYTKK